MQLQDGQTISNEQECIRVIKGRRKKNLGEECIVSISGLKLQRLYTKVQRVGDI